MKLFANLSNAFLRKIFQCFENPSNGGVPLKINIWVVLNSQAFEKMCTSNRAAQDQTFVGWADWDYDSWIVIAFVPSQNMPARVGGRQSHAGDVESQSNQRFFLSISASRQNELATDVPIIIKKWSLLWKNSFVWRKKSDSVLLLASKARKRLSNCGNIYSFGAQ